MKKYEIKVIDSDQAREVIKGGQLGLFIVEEGDGTFTAIDNENGDAWVEVFRDKGIAEKWLRGEIEIEEGEGQNYIEIVQEDFQDLHNRLGDILTDEELNAIYYRKNAPVKILSFVNPKEGGHVSSGKNVGKMLGQLFDAVTWFDAHNVADGDFLKALNRMRWFLHENLKAEGWEISIRNGRNFKIKPGKDYHDRRKTKRDLDRAELEKTK